MLVFLVHGGKRTISRPRASGKPGDGRRLHLGDLRYPRRWPPGGVGGTQPDTGRGVDLHVQLVRQGARQWRAALLPPPGVVHVTQHVFPDRMHSAFSTPDLHRNWLLEMLSMNDCLYCAHAQFVINFDEILYLAGGATNSEFLAVVAHTAHARRRGEPLVLAARRLLPSYHASRVFSCVARQLWVGRCTGSRRLCTSLPEAVPVGGVLY